MATQTKRIKFDRKTFTNLLTCAGYTLCDFAVDLEIDDDNKKFENDLFVTGVTEKDAIWIYGELFKLLSETRDGCAECMHCDDPKFVYFIKEESVTENKKQRSWAAPFAVKTPEEAFEYLHKVSSEKGVWHYDFDTFEDSSYMIKAVGVGDFLFGNGKGGLSPKKGTCTITIQKIRVRG